MFAASAEFATTRRFSQGHKAKNSFLERQIVPQSINKD
jgi:hypothetical protein